ncbi:MAG: bifunctional DedA family/phosphatase PAP2 family protein [Actinobacteria bacterium]|nr:bifunctional DedA family/phosphatase PAP2 family protein [Actinomycetota bacterium]
MGLVFPGETVVFLGGVLASQHRLSLWLVILIGCLGAIIGDSVGYEVGHHYGNRLLATLPTWLVKPENIEKAQDLLRSNGGFAVFIGRFTAALRALVPGLAGSSRLAYRRFLIFNVLGGVLWVTVIALVGYFAGSSFHAAEHRVSLISFGVLAVVVAAVVYHFLSHSERVRRWTYAHLGFLLRLDRSVVLGLSVLVVSGWLFGGLLQDVLARDGVALADPALLGAVMVHRTGWLTVIATGVTQLGWSPVVYALLLATGVLVWHRQHDWRRPVLALAVLGAGQLLHIAMMDAVHRVRPPREFWLVQPYGFSFPSGHTMTATVGYALLAWLLCRFWLSKQVVLIVLAGGLAVTVGMSRVYLGVHWPSDVLASWCLGIAWLSLASLATLTWRFQQAQTKGLEPTEEQDCRNN